MTSPSPENRVAIVTPPRLTDAEVKLILSQSLIANLATLDAAGTIHVVPMWFEHVDGHIHIPTSRYTRKYRNIRRHPHATVMVDISRSGLDLRGVLIRGSVDLVEGDQARELNRSIHLRYVKPEGLEEPDVREYLVAGDDVTIRVSVDQVVTWNHANSPAGRSLARSGNHHVLDD